ncbi:hypothetical protein AB0K18_36180 [Nonomuraea sp. NPDC049421]|uniref:hypothetical protein n=1 Tax=Nonomuraea sp. NPDC049421 TaxID=3155275 RepID=UPI003414500E
MTDLRQDARTEPRPHPLPRPRDAGNFASASLPRHLARGALGFGALIASVALIPSIGPMSLLLAPLGVVAFRGCPTCWVIGLIQTISMGRLRRACVDGRCELVAAPARGTGERAAHRDERPWGAPARQDVTRVSPSAESGSATGWK